MENTIESRIRGSVLLTALLSALTVPSCVTGASDLSSNTNGNAGAPGSAAGTGSASAGTTANGGAGAALGGTSACDGQTGIPLSLIHI